MDYHLAVLGRIVILFQENNINGTIFHSSQKVKVGKKTISFQQKKQNTIHHQNESY